MTKPPHDANAKIIQALKAAGLDLDAVPSFQPQTVLTQHGMDSLMMAMVALELERVFALTIPATLVTPTTFASVETIAHLLSRLPKP